MELPLWPIGKAHFANMQNKAYYSLECYTNLNDRYVGLGYPHDQLVKRIALIFLAEPQPCIRGSGFVSSLCPGRMQETGFPTVL